MRTLLIAIGNTLRRDDGVAHYVLRLAGDVTGVDRGVESRTVMQATPELAAELARFGQVIFLDADAMPGEVRLEPIAADAVRGSALGHAMGAAEVVALARALFGFQGEAFLCRIPGEDFTAGEGLSERARENAAKARTLLLAVLSTP